MTQIGNTRVGFATRVLKYIALGIIIVPLSIVSHELGHFLAYHFFGADNVQLHSVSVSADKDALTSFQLAFVNIVGPIISYVTIGLALLFSRKKYIAFWVLLGLAAPIGRIVNGVYVYFRALGYSPNPNFDEYNFSRNTGFDPIALAVVTTLIALATMVIFLRKSWVEGRFPEFGFVIFSVASGLATWMTFGGILLP